MALPSNTIPPPKLTEKSGPSKKVYQFLEDADIDA